MLEVVAQVVALWCAGVALFALYVAVVLIGDWVRAKLKR